jgi:hypothetical protein
MAREDDDDAPTADVTDALLAAAPPSSTGADPGPRAIGTYLSSWVT